MPAKEFFALWGKLRKLLEKTPEYIEFRSIVKNSQSYLCTCGKPGRQVHHMTRVYDDPTLAIDPDNGVYLCVKCHKKEHKDGSGKVKLFRFNKWKTSTT